MKLKMTPDGHAVVKNGMPVYVHDDGREEGIDAPAAMKLLISKHFESSPVMAGLKIPPEIAAAAFGDSFKIEGGKLVAIDQHGIQMYSRTQHGEAASFDDAFGQLLDRYQHKDQIIRKDGAQTPEQQGQTAATVTRQQFDAMAHDKRAKFIKDGGRIGDEAHAAVATAPAGGQQSGGKPITRTVFDSLAPTARMNHVRAGGTVVD